MNILHIFHILQNSSTELSPSVGLVSYSRLSYRCDCKGVLYGRELHKLYFKNIEIYCFKKKDLPRRNNQKCFFDKEREYN